MVATEKVDQRGPEASFRAVSVRRLAAARHDLGDHGEMVRGEAVVVEPLREYRVLEDARAVADEDEVDAAVRLDGAEAVPGGVGAVGRLGGDGAGVRESRLGGGGEEDPDRLRGGIRVE